MRRWPLAALLVTLAAGGAPLAPCATERGEKIEYDWSAGVIRVRGSAPIDGTDDRARAMARRVAVVDGYRTIAEAMQGVLVTSDYSVMEVAVASPTVRTQLDAFIRGAQVVSEQDIPGEPPEIEVVMEAPLRGEAGLTEAVIEPAAEPTTPAPPTDPTPPIEPVQIAVTGIVIDCRPPAGRTDFPMLTPALFPTITDENGQTIYSSDLVDPGVLAALGGAHYFDVALADGEDPNGTVDLAAARERIGDQPLWLRGVVVGGPTSSLYLPNEAAARLRELRDTPIIRQARVIILRRNVAAPPAPDAAAPLPPVAPPGV